MNVEWIIVAWCLSGIFAFSLGLGFDKNREEREEYLKTHGAFGSIAGSALFRMIALVLVVGEIAGDILSGRKRN